eukprot:1157396-Pelagomonas_calceolata.AAC.6
MEHALYGPEYTALGVRPAWLTCAPVVPFSSSDALLPLQMIEFFDKRRIRKATLEKFGIKMAPNVKHAMQGESENAIAFPYKRNGEVVNVKYRTLSKKFWQV